MNNQIFVMCMLCALSLAACSLWFDSFDFQFGAAGGSGGGNAGVSGEIAGANAPVPCSSDTVCARGFQCKSKVCVLNR
jgi:hypothetical protein